MGQAFLILKIMINVIILTRNKNYSVLDVPSNGKLVINERHLVVGIVQNGVKCIAYGSTSPLSAFETYLQNECNGVEMIDQNLYQQEGRTLDFTVIELLQSQFTSNTADSGSDVIQPVTTYMSLGYPIKYNFKVKGADFGSLAEGREWFANHNAQAASDMQNAVVNALTTDDQGYQMLSVVPGTFGVEWSGKKLLNVGITEFYDMDGLFTLLGSYGLTSNTIQKASFPNVTACNKFLFEGSTVMDLLTPKLQTFGDTVGKDSSDYNGTTKVQIGIKWSVSDFMATSNSGLIEGDIQHAIDARSAQITFVTS